MRNRLVHAYHATDPYVLWETIATDVPGVRALLGS
jgi:uncharacterized protein with HEPN domain